MSQVSKQYRRPAIKPETASALEEFKSPGQTDDGAIRELLQDHGIEIGETQ